MKASILIVATLALVLVTVHAQLRNGEDDELYQGELFHGELFQGEVAEANARTLSAVVKCRKGFTFVAATKKCAKCDYHTYDKPSPAHGNVCIRCKKGFKGNKTRTGCIAYQEGVGR